MQVGGFRIDGDLARLQFAELSDERRRIAACLNGSYQPRDALLNVLPLAHQLVLLVYHIVALGELNHLLNGLRRERVLLDGL